MEEKLETANPTETPKKEEKEEKEEKPTLEGLSKRNKELNDKMDKVLKQNSDKDSHISIVENENAQLRETLQKVTTSIEGKTEKQKDAIMEKERQRLIDKGFDPDAVDSILESIETIADQKADKKNIPIIMDYAQGLIESDPEIDKEFLEKNGKAITEEYSSYKSELSPRKIKANLKKAYEIVREKLAKEAKKEKAGEEEAEREKMLPGGSPAPKGGKEEPKDDFLDRIDKAGPGKNSHFV